MIQEKTGHTPEALSKRPTLSLRWQFADHLWNKVGGSRNWTAAGPAQIPVSEFLAWCELTNYPVYLRTSSWEDLHTFDVTWLSVKHKIDEAKRVADEQKAKLKQGRRKR